MAHFMLDKKTSAGNDGLAARALPSSPTSTTPQTLPYSGPENGTANTNHAAHLGYISEQTDILVSDMRSYIHHTYFDAAGFESRAEDFGNQLRKIAIMLASLDSYSGQIHHRIVFANHVYRLMTLSAAYINKIMTTNRKEDFMVHTIVEVNVMVLKLYSSYGVPDRQIAGYAKEAKRLSRFVKHWKTTVENLPPPPLPVQVLLQKQYAQAYNTLEHLDSFEVSQAGERTGTQVVPLKFV